MAKKKFCPICDQPINGRFCKRCMEFVTPYEREADYHMNESHDPDKDRGCEYHEANPNLKSKEDKAKEDRARMEKAKKSFETHGQYGSGVTYRVSYSKGSTDSQGDVAKNTKKLVKLVVIIISLFCVLPVIISFLVILFETFSSLDFSGGYPEPDNNYIESDDYDGNMDYPFHSDDYLDDDEYQSLAAEKGFESDGFKAADLDEIKKAGEPCNGYVHFDIKSRTAIRHLLSSLDEAGLVASSETGASDNYYYLDRYGNVYSYFVTDNYIGFYGSSSDDEPYGYADLISDTVTDELMSVELNFKDNIDDFYLACYTVLNEFSDDLDVDFDSSFKDDLYDVLEGTDEDSNYEILTYDNLSLYVGFGKKDADYILYSAEITLEN